MSYFLIQIIRLSPVEIKLILQLAILVLLKHRRAMNCSCFSEFIKDIIIFFVCLFFFVFVLFNDNSECNETAGEMNE